MKKNEIQDIINQIDSIGPILQELEIKAREYRNQGIEHELDGHILFKLELLHEKLTTILYHFYLGDIDRDYKNGEITSEERDKLYSSQSGKTPSENEAPFFSFGYMISDFIDNL